MSDAIVHTAQQPGDPQRAPRSSAPPSAAATRAAGGPTECLVPAGFAFEGTVAFDGRARIDGLVTGPVEGRGRLEIGETGALAGDVRADEVVVAGAVEGDVVGADRVEIQAGARVRGAVRAPRLRMYEGAIIDGPCRVEPGPSGPDSGMATDGCAG